ALPTATQSIAASSSEPAAASSSEPAAATPTSSSTRNGNGASVAGVQPVSAFIAVGMTVALSLL
ncbi:hypothetical protein FRC00_004016, partial [Tulasnella sp. 408]